MMAKVMFNIEMHIEVLSHCQRSKDLVQHASLMEKFMSNEEVAARNSSSNVNCSRIKDPRETVLTQIADHPENKHCIHKSERKQWNLEPNTILKLFILFRSRV